jgi:HlyD family secretion protein
MVREARAAVDATRVELRYAGIEQKRADQLRARNAGSERAQDVARSRREMAAAALAQAEAKLASLDVQLAYTTVRAPLAGRVLDVFVEEGNAVSPVTAVTGGTLLLSIAGETSLHLKGLVDENEVARVQVGQPARLRTEAFAGRVFEGAVRKIAPLGQRVQNVTYFEVEIAVTDRDA